MLETAHHQADSRGQADEDDGETDEHRHLDVHPQHAVYVSEGAAGLATAVSLVVCCFKHGCPLYDTCSGGYSRADNLPYGSDYDGSDQVSPRLC